MIIEEVEYTDIKVDAFLEHFGVKGMKWGVRKSPAQIKAKKAKASSKKERKAHSKLTLGEAAVAGIFAGPVGILAYKAIKVNTAKQKQRSRDSGGGVKEQTHAAKVDVGRTIAVGLLATPLTAALYAGAKTSANANVGTFKKKK